MNTPKSVAKRGEAPHQTRISAATRKAIDLVIRNGASWNDAAEAAGVTYGAIWKARQRPAVKQYLEEKKAEYIQEVEAMKAPHKARALEVARHLLEDSKSDAVKARMVEFLAGESKGQTINIGISTGSGGPSAGYEFVRPGQEVVMIRPARRSDTTEDADIIDP
jgi:predicted transcriptional regulator